MGTTKLLAALLIRVLRVLYSIGKRNIFLMLLLSQKNKVECWSQYGSKCKF